MARIPKALLSKGVKCTELFQTVRRRGKNWTHGVLDFAQCTLFFAKKYFWKGTLSCTLKKSSFVQHFSFQLSRNCEVFLKRRSKRFWKGGSEWNVYICVNFECYDFCAKGVQILRYPRQNFWKVNFTIYLFFQDHLSMIIIPLQKFTDAPWRSAFHF